MTIIQNNKIKPRLVIFKCDYCNNNFSRGSKTKPRLDCRILIRNEHFCSNVCAYNGRKPRTAKKISCNFCKKEYYKAPSIIKETNFCSTGCYWKYRKIDPRVSAPRKPCSEERKRKISKANKGNQNRLGVKFSEKSKKKMSIAAKKRFKNSKNNPMYGRKHTQKSRELMSESHSNLILNGRKVYGFNHKSGYHFSEKINSKFYYRSSWEKQCMIWFDCNESIIEYKYEPIKIPYYLKNKNGFLQKRFYIPDFIITYLDNRKEVWEIKPKIFWHSDTNKEKVKAAINFCKQNNLGSYKLLGKKELEKLNIL